MVSFEAFRFLVVGFRNLYLRLDLWGKVVQVARKFVMLVRLLVSRGDVVNVKFILAVVFNFDLLTCS